MRVSLAELDDEACGRIPFTVMFGRAIVVHNGFGHQRNHGTHVWMDHRGAQHLMIIGARTMAVDFGQARGTVPRLGGKIAGAIKGQSIPVIQKHHRFERLPALELGQHALAHRAERLRGDRVTERAHVCRRGHARYRRWCAHGPRSAPCHRRGARVLSGKTGRRRT